MTGRISGVRTRVRTRRVITVTDPAVGTDWMLTVPGGHAYQILSTISTLTTDATVVDRTPRLVLRQDGAPVWESVDTVSAGDSQSGIWTAAPLVPTATGNTMVQLTLPVACLPAGGQIGMVTDGLQAGDQWSGITVWVIDEWIHAGPIDLDRLDIEVVGVIEPAQ